MLLFIYWQETFIKLNCGNLSVELRRIIIIRIIILRAFFRQH